MVARRVLIQGFDFFRKIAVKSNIVIIEAHIIIIRYNSVKSVICHNSGLGSISKFFRLAISRSVNQWSCIGCLIGWKDEIVTESKKM